MFDFFKNIQSKPTSILGRHKYDQDLTNIPLPKGKSILSAAKYSQYEGIEKEELEE